MFDRPLALAESNGAYVIHTPPLQTKLSDENVVERKTAMIAIGRETEATRK